jgi:hypothetical protein
MQVIYKVDQVAEMFQCSAGFINQLMAKGKIKPHRIGHAVRFTPGDIERFLGEKFIQWDPEIMSAGPEIAPDSLKAFCEVLRGKKSGRFALEYTVQNGKISKWGIRQEEMNMVDTDEA